MAQHRTDPLQPAASRRDSADLHRIALGPNAAADALGHLRAFAEAQRCGLAPALAIIVEELVFNLVDHGVAGEALLGFALAPEGVRLTLIDQGAPFDLREAPPPGELPPERGGGAGLALVRAWSREIDYRPIDGRNRLDLLVPFETH